MSFPAYMSYKDSGIEGLGKMPEHWISCRLRDVCLSIDTGPFGTSLKSEDYVEGAVPVINPSHILDSKLVPEESVTITQGKAFELKRWRMLPGDLVVARRGEIGRAAICTEENSGWVCGTGSLRVRADRSKVTGEFLLACIRSSFSRYWLELSSVGSTMVNLNERIIGSLPLVIPPTTKEQSELVNWIRRQTNEIELLAGEQRQLIELLQEKRQAVISHAVTKGLNPKAPMKPSGVEWLGDVPAHWQLAPTKRLFRLVAEPAPDSNDYELLSIYTDIGVRPRKDLEAKGNKATTTDGYWMVRKGDLVVNKLLAWMGAIGISEFDGVTSPAYDILRQIVPMEPRFYDRLFRCGACFSEFRRYSRGIMDMRLRLYFEELGQMLMPYPPMEEQVDIVQFLQRETDMLESLILEVSQSIALLKERRSAIISAAVTGKVDVRQAVLEPVA